MSEHRIGSVRGAAGGPAAAAEPHTRSVTLTPSAASAATRAAPADSQAARSVLADLQRTLRDASGRPRTGLLRLRRSEANESGDAGTSLPRFEHQSSFHLNRVSRSQVQDTARALRRVFAEAGLPARAQQELEHYLSENGERAQVSRIIELIDQHMPPPSASPDKPSR